MKSLLFVCAIVFAIGSAVAQKTPAVPQLPQQFYSNFTVVFSNFVSPSDSPVFISGFFAFDYVSAGFFLEIGGEEFIPLSFHTNFVVSPDGLGNADGYMYEGPLCWKFGPIPAGLLVYYPFELPTNVTFLGKKVVSGQPCTGWRFQTYIIGDDDNTFNFWVSTQTPTTIVQIDVFGLEYVGDLQINFFNTVVGPFSPLIYAPPNKVNPNLTCKPFSWPSMIKRMTSVVLGMIN